MQQLLFHMFVKKQTFLQQPQGAQLLTWDYTREIEHTIFFFVSLEKSWRLRMLQFSMF